MRRSAAPSSGAARTPFPLENAMKSKLSALTRSGLFVLGALAGTSLPATAGPISVPPFNIAPTAKTPDAASNDLREWNVGSPAMQGGSDGMVQLVHDGGFHVSGGDDLFITRGPRGATLRGSDWPGGGEWNNHGRNGGVNNNWGWGWGGAALLGWGLTAVLPLYPGYEYYGPYDPDYGPQRSVQAWNPHIEWCTYHYRSYRVADNTFRPNGGPRRQCVSPYG